MEDNQFEDVSDEDSLVFTQSDSETENADSQTSEDEEEIDLEQMNLDEKYTQQSSYSSRSGMIWSSSPFYSLNTKLCTNIIGTSKLTEIDQNVASVEDSFLCFISEEMLKKILLYTNIHGSENVTSR